MKAEDGQGQPLHPMLRRLWDAVDTSEHTILIKRADTKSYFAGRFEVTAVDPEGRAHQYEQYMRKKLAEGGRAADAGPLVPREEPVRS